MAFATVGSIIAARRPRNLQGWVFSAAGVQLGMSRLSTAYGAAALADLTLPFGPTASWLSTWMWAVGIAVLWTGLQVFPDGRPVSPGWRWGLWVGIVGVVAALGAAALAWPLRDVLRPTGDFERYTGAAGVAAAVAAVAFVPVRRKVQAVVDRRFNRSHYDARLVVEQFGVRLQHDHDIEVMARDLGAAVDATVQPGHVAPWIRRQPEVR